MEGHHLLFICSCGNFAGYKDTTTKYGNARLFRERATVTQVDVASWEVARKNISRLPETPLSLLVKPKKPTKDCLPGRQGDRASFSDYRIPRVATVGPTQENSRAAEARSSLEKIHKVKQLMTQLETKIWRQDIEKRLAWSHDNLDAL